MIIRVGIYARSSPDCPLSIDDQMECLQAIAVERGWTVTGVFTDRPTTVRTRLDRRPGELGLVEAIQSRVIDKVLVWSVCRIGKSLVELVGFMETCRINAVSVYLHGQNIDTIASNGRSVFDLCSMMTLHLHQSRRDRILRGQAAARSLSIRFGRPPISITKVERAKRELAAGRGVREAARTVGISAASVSRLKTTMSKRQLMT
jgi:DNA invertase Pin-like site-specific DNA recombinase